MKKLLFFAAALCCSTILFAQNADWIGNSCIVINGTWYDGSFNSAGLHEAFDANNLGNLSELKICAQIQSWGEDDAEHNPTYMKYHFDDLDAWYTLDLNWFKYADNNNWFGCGGDPEQSQPVQEAVVAEGFADLANGDHVLEIYFMKPSTKGDKYDSQGGANFKANFTKTPTTGIDHVVGNAASLKVMENGVLYIYRNGVKYDTNGKAIR